MTTVRHPAYWWGVATMVALVVVVWSFRRRRR
jgi:cbb3-type cytochrome oxidase subunit 3